MFRRSQQSYGRTSEPETPYQRAGQVWDERLGSARVQAQNWRFMALGGLSLSMLLGGAVVWQSTVSRVTPYVVEVTQNGEARAVAPAEVAYTPTDAQIAWFLSRFVTNVRSLSTDPILVRQHWLEAYDFAAGHAVQFLNDYARTNDPFSGVGQKSVSVQITSVVRASDRSFQVKWTEQTYRDGSLSGTEHWTALLTTVSQTPRTVEVLRKNPLGIYVSALDWSRELNLPTLTNAGERP